MGFLGTLGSGLAGLALGGPIGAAGGIIASLGGDSDRTSRTSNTSSGTNTTSVDLRSLTGQEQSIIDQAMSGLSTSLEGMSPEDQQALRDRMYTALFDPASQQISDTFDTRAAERYSNSAARGAASTSRRESLDQRDVALEAKEQGQASQAATVGAEQLALAREEQNRLTQSAYLAALQTVWQNVIATSPVTQTYSQTGTGSQIAAPNIAAGVGGMLALSGASENSWINNQSWLPSWLSS